MAQLDGRRLAVARGGGGGRAGACKNGGGGRAGASKNWRGRLKISAFISGECLSLWSE